MATVIGFSARKGDNILVDEDIENVRNDLMPNALTPDGFCQLTRIPRKFEVFDPVTVYVNPDRIAYLHEVLEH